MLVYFYKLHYLDTYILTGVLINCSCLWFVQIYCDIISLFTSNLVIKNIGNTNGTGYYNYDWTAFLEVTTKALKKGDRVALVGFGSFSVSKRAARKGRNPQTGKEIKIAAKKVVKFKAGADLAGKVNN